MRIREPVTVEQQQLVAVVCDRCKHRVEAGDFENGFDEFATFSGSGGYASRHWGDETRWWVDLCEKCQHELFGAFANTDDRPV